MVTIISLVERFLRGIQLLCSEPDDLYRGIKSDYLNLYEHQSEQKKYI